MAKSLNVYIGGNTPGVTVDLSAGKVDATTADMIAWNERVQNALLTVRPYGQTPIAGMLADAKHFLLEDLNNTDPYVGGTIDTSFMTQVGKGCRFGRTKCFS